MSDEKRMLSLPAPVSSAPSEVMLERPTVYQAHAEPSDSDASTVPLSHYLWLLNREKCAATVPALREGLTHWPGGRDAAQRKQKLFTDEWLELALNRLANSTFLPQPSLNLA